MFVLLYRKAAQIFFLDATSYGICVTIPCLSRPIKPKSGGISCARQFHARHTSLC